MAEVRARAEKVRIAIFWAPRDSPMLTPFLYLWAFPATAIGLSFVPLAWLLTGGTVAWRDGCLEASGGWTGAILRRGLPLLGAPAAICLAHVILARDEVCLDASRDHEHVHTRQYERWGPLMIPLYVGRASSSGAVAGILTSTIRSSARPMLWRIES
jgi:hypothetical protein